MAKLSKRVSKRVAFVASKLALSIDQDERMALLTELLDELGIDAEQRTDSKESAARHLRYEAAQRRKASAKPSAADPIDNMSRDDLRAHIDELRAKRDRLLAERRAEQQPAITPEPAPIVVEAAKYTLPTAKQRRALAAFDDMTDAEQVDSLRGMWGPA